VFPWAFALAVIGFLIALTLMKPPERKT